MSDRVPRTPFIFIGGKGGVGKTTVAAATALKLMRRGERVLLFSSDPAHSVSDSFEKRTRDKPYVVARDRQAELIVFEMDAFRAMEAFKNRHAPILREIADRGTLLDDEDIDSLLGLSLPGLDEVMALFSLSEVEREGTYSRIVVDTAPSGHTMRLLELPDVFDRWLSALDCMSDKYRFLAGRFAIRRLPGGDRVDAFLKDMSDRVESVRVMMHASGRSSFVLVAIPEAMSVEETIRYGRFLEEKAVPLTHLIVNRVGRSHGKCVYCRSRARTQRPHLARLRESFKALEYHTVPLFEEEIHGVGALTRFGDALWTGSAKRSNASMPAPADDAPAASVAGHGRFPLDVGRVVIFGGKGGVGKTTSAAATAIALAREAPESRILVLSTDPAHSLSDSFDETIGELGRGLGGCPNLDGMEVDPSVRFEELKERYRQWIDALFASLSGSSGLEVQFDREAMRELVTLSPPGVDEIAALSVVADLVEENRYARIVLDTAPTGHLVRFLELPDVALAWVRTFLKLLLKYRGVVESESVSEELIVLSRNIKKVIALFRDPEACDFVVVAIPEQMSVRESARLLDSLERLSMAIRGLLINGFVSRDAAASCPFCQQRKRNQQRAIRAYRRRFPRGSTYLAPEQPWEVRGAERLSLHFAAWRRLESTRSSAGAKG